MRSKSLLRCNRKTDSQCKQTLFSRPNLKMSFDFGVDIDVDSQDSQLNEEELDKLVEDSKAKNTKKCTTWGLKKFFQWSTKRNVQVDLKTITMEDLNDTLRRFYAEVKSEKKNMLSPSALTGIRAALHRALSSAPYHRNFNIIKDREFMTSNQMFIACCKLYCKTNNNKAQHKSAIEPADMCLLRNYFENLHTDPVKLQEYVWFSICLHFGRSEREGWRELNRTPYCES